MIWIILGFLIYSLVGILVCEKIGVLYGNDDLLDSVVDGIMVAFWPLTVLFHFLFEL